MSDITTMTMLEKAHHFYKNTPPEWIIELATYVDLNGLKATGKTIGYSPAVVSTVIKNDYQGDVLKVQQKVQGALMGANVDCPVLGLIGRNICLDWQKKPFAATNSTRARLHRACRSGCVHSRLKKGSRYAE